MIVCVCNGLSSRTCANLVGSGCCRSVGCIFRLQGARVRCGKCLPMMQELYARHGPGEGEVAAPPPSADAGAPPAAPPRG
jgi:bacterioferritin-associated ferredoxin